MPRVIEVYRTSHGYSIQDPCHLVSSNEDEFRTIDLPRSTKLGVVSQALPGTGGTRLGSEHAAAFRPARTCRESDSRNS